MKRTGIMAILLVMALLAGSFPLAISEEAEAPGMQAEGVVDEAEIYAAPVEAYVDESTVYSAPVEESADDTCELESLIELSGEAYQPGEVTDAAAEAPCMTLEELTSEQDGDVAISPPVATDGFTVEKGVLVAWTSDPTVVTLAIPDNLGIKTIGKACFKDATSIQTVILPNTLTTIEENAFSGCKGLQQILMPESLVTIGNGAFSGCAGIQSVIIPANVKTIGDNAFASCGGLQELMINGKKLQTIGDGAFWQCTSLAAVTLPSSVLHIGQSAFEGDISLKTVSLGKNLKEMGCSAFSGSAVEAITIPGTLTQLPAPGGWDHKGVFEDCANLLTVKIEEGVTAIGERAFAGCGALKNVDIPASVSTIGEEAFNNCAALNNIVIQGNGLKAIERCAFNNCASIESIGIPSSVETIGEACFSGCKAIKTLSLPAGLKSIGAGAFCYTEAMTSIDLGTSLTSLGCYNTFYKSGIKSIVIPGTLKTVEGSVGELSFGAFTGCDGLEKIVLQSGVTTIGPAAFYGCPGLKEIVIPSTVTSIGDYAFAGCGAMETITIPKSIAQIGKDIFNSCLALRTVCVYADSYALKYCTDNKLAYTIIDENVIASVTLDKTALTLRAGEAAKLNAAVLPEYAKEKGVQWTSSNAAVATVSDGTVTGVAPGSAVITCVAVGDPTKVATCTVTVAGSVIPVTGVTLSQASASIVKGGTLALTASVSPADATNAAVIWSSSNTAVASVADGTVTAVAAGKAIITATSAADATKSASCEVTVTEAVIPVQSVTLKQTSISLVKGESTVLTVSVTPAKATDKKVAWTSSNAAVATVADGTVTAVAPGSALITVYSVSTADKSASCMVTVTEAAIPVTGIAVSQPTLSLGVGGKASLAAIIEPANATEQGVVWESSDASVAKVSEGLVTALKEGTATITVTAKGNAALKAVCEVKVTSEGSGAIGPNSDPASIRYVQGLLIAFGSLPEGSADGVYGSTTVEAVKTFQNWVNQSRRELILNVTGTVDSLTKSYLEYCYEHKMTMTVVVGVTAITLDAATLSLTQGATQKLTASVQPDNATNKTVMWNSSDASVATVTEGTVTAIKSGTAVIMAITADGGRTASCTVTVNDPIPVHVLSKTGKNGTVTVAAGTQLKLDPAFAVNGGWTVTEYKSSKTKVATVDASGLVTAGAEGKTKITVMTSNKKKKAKLTIHVVDPNKPAGVTLAQGKSVTLALGTTLQLNAALVPATAQSPLAWKSSKMKVATVDANGLVTPLAEGKTKITVTTRNNKKAKIVVNVVNPNNPSGVGIVQGKQATMKVGETLQLTAVLEPGTAVTSLTWVSGKTKVATVSQTGLVTALKKGTATITVRTANKKKAKIKIKVVN